MTHKTRPEAAVELTVEKGTITSIHINDTRYNLDENKVYVDALTIAYKNAKTHDQKQLLHLMQMSAPDIALRELTPEATQTILKEKKHFHVTATGTDAGGAKLEGEMSYEKLCQLLTANEAIQTLKEKTSGLRPALFHQPHPGLQRAHSVPPALIRLMQR